MYRLEPRDVRIRTYDVQIGTYDVQRWRLHITTNYVHFAYLVHSYYVFSKMNLTVTKSNALLEASYQLNARAQKLVLCLIAKINPTKDSPKAEASITASEFAELMDIPMRNAHRDLHMAADALFDAQILIREGNLQRRIRWLQEDTIKLTGEGTVTVTWSNRILRHLHNLKYRDEVGKGYRSYHLKNIANLDTSHAIRLYEILIKWATPGNSKGWRHIPLDEFKEVMGIADKYPQYGELNRRVIAPALKQINESSNLTVSLEPKRKGRKIVSLRFDFKVDDQMQLDLGESSPARQKKQKKQKNLSTIADENTKKLVAKYGEKGSLKNSKKA